jgi:hypothetical protein
MVEHYASQRDFCGDRRCETDNSANDYRSHNATNKV